MMVMRLEIIKRLTAGIMAGSMLICIVMPCTMADDTYIYIRNAADMKDLADKCMLDGYSAGKVVILDCDVDLSGSGFTYIPFFGGVFDGGGYTISGVDIEVNNPERGFIGTIGIGGEVKNLNVVGALKEGEAPNGEKNKTGGKAFKLIDNIHDESKSKIDRYFVDTGIYSVGGIAGVNKGSIISCSFNGSVSINKNCGGIAGVNEGRIESSTNYADVMGDDNTGGIAGKNSGIIKWSVNYGRINDHAIEGMYAAGGIAGYSDGVIEACTNYGEIGYKNTGSATGGIVGAQSGNISECRNMGAVYGKKRIGGISGNFEPYTNITYNPDDISDKINEEKAKLRQDLDDISNRFDNSRQRLRDDLNDFDTRLRDFFGLGNTGSGGDIVNSLVDLNEALARRVDGANSFAAIADTLARAEEDLSSNNAELRLLFRDVRENAGRMADSTEGLAGSLTESNAHINSLMDSLNDNLSDSEKRKKTIETIDALNDAINSTSDAMDHLSTLRMPNLNFNVDVLDRTDNQLANALKKINGNLDGLLDPFIKMSDAFGNAYDSLAERKAKLEELKKKLEDWLEQSDPEKPTIEPLPSFLPIENEKPDRAMYNPFVKTAYAADDRSDKTTLERLLDMDIHDLDIPLNRTICGEEYEMAVIRYCVNEGAVTGSSDIGGISGGTGFGAGIGGSFDNISFDGEDFSLNPSTAIKSVISACINEGDISAKNTSAGGITGFSDLGKIKDSINCGNIEVSDGSYAGGISGYNCTEVMRSINTGDVDAQSDIGGITGYGRDIRQTYALTRTSGSTERTGAIAGTADGELEHNYFLKEKLGGINGVDYNDKAQSVTKEVLAVDGDISTELNGLENRYWTGTSGDLYMPQLRAFTENTAGTISDLLRAKSAACALFRFSVDFVIDGESVKVINLDYGERIPGDQIPEIPKKNGQYGVWDSDVKEPIIRNTKFTAEYNRSMSTLSYGGEPPQILVEGDFRPDAELVVEEFNPDAIINNARYTPTAGYALMVLENDKKYEGEMSIHVRVPKKSGNLKIGLITNNAVVVSECEQDGSYLVFNPNGAERFIVLKAKRNIIPFVIIGLALGICVALAFLFRRRLQQRILFEKVKLLAERISQPLLAQSNKNNGEPEKSEADTEVLYTNEDTDWEHITEE